MSAFKQLTSNDIIVSPLEVSKHFVTETIPLTQSGGGYDFVRYSFIRYGENPPNTGHYPNNLGIDSYVGRNVKYVDSGQNTGFFASYNEANIYNSIKHLYYHNFISGGKDQNGINLAADADLPYFRPDGVVTGSTYNTNYENYSQTDLLDNRTYPTGSGDYVGILSIPQGIFGDYIQPGSFKLEAPNYSGSGGGLLYDDGQGRILTGSRVVGNIIYTHGIATFTDFTPGAGYHFQYYATESYGEDASNYHTLLSFFSGSEATASFSSSYTMYETQYKCTIGESEYNYTQNPSALKDNNGNPYDYITGSYFNPYVTTVGLYNDAYELLAVGKLGKPLPTSNLTDTTILVNIDRQ